MNSVLLTVPEIDRVMADAVATVLRSREPHVGVGVELPRSCDLSAGRFVHVQPEGGSDLAHFAAAKGTVRIAAYAPRACEARRLAWLTRTLLLGLESDDVVFLAVDLSDPLGDEAHGAHVAAFSAQVMVRFQPA